MRVSLQDIGIVVAPVLLVILMFFIPISPTGLSVFLVCGSLVLISIPYYRRISFYTWFSTTGILAIALFTFVIIAAAWSPASLYDQFLVVTKYFKFFYLPIVAVSFINPKMRQWSLNAYLLAMSVTACISIAMAKGLIVSSVEHDPGGVFYNHIVTSFMMSFASYLSALFILKYKGWPRWIYLFIFLLTSFQILFVNTGRTGYLIYFILIILFLAQQMSFRQAAVGIVFFCSLMGLCYKVSPTMNTQLNGLANEVHLFTQDHKETSLGYRVAFHHYARTLLAEHPILGVGTGGFKYRFVQANPIPSWGLIINEPHSQYWFLLAEQGIIGFSLFVGFLLSLLYLSLQLKEMKPVLLGFTLVFAIACLSDTIFSYSVIGYLLIMITAICFGELHEQREASELR